MEQYSGLRAELRVAQNAKHAANPTAPASALLLVHLFLPVQVLRFTTHHNRRALHRRTREAAKPKAGRAVVSGGALLAPSSRKTKLKPAGPKPKAGPVAPSPAKSDCSDLDFLEDFNF